MFYFIFSFFFCSLLLITSFLVLLSLNPVQSILLLILSFLLCACLFLLLGAEFIAIILLIVYVGAISILFLFVVMMLNLRLFEIYFDFFSYVPVGAIIGFFFLIQFYAGLFNDWGIFFSDFFIKFQFFVDWADILWSKSNGFFLGLVFFNYYSFLIFLSALILFMAMLGVIALTIDLDLRTLVKRFISLNTSVFSVFGFINWGFI